MAHFQAGERGQCPHCNTVVRFESLEVGGPGLGGAGVVKSAFRAVWLTLDAAPTLYQLYTSGCPNCHQAILTLRLRSVGEGPEYTLWPQHGARPVPPEVPEAIADLYREASAVLAVSERASAALSRLCLESVLSDPNAGNANQRDLSAKIDQVKSSLPPRLAEQVDAIRQIGNFAVHPIKSTSSGEILDVEPAEAEWNLEILATLFEYYYVQPIVIEQRRAALDAKLADAGRKSLK